MTSSCHSCHHAARSRPRWPPGPSNQAYLSSPHLEASPAMTFRACSSPAPTPFKPQPEPAILSQESVHTTLSITHHTRKQPSTGPRTTHGPQSLEAAHRCEAPGGRGSVHRSSTAANRAVAFSTPASGKGGAARCEAGARCTLGRRLRATSGFAFIGRSGAAAPWRARQEPTVAAMASLGQDGLS
jgi:hypothetical protein